MKGYIIGKNILRFELDDNNLVVTNISNNIPMTIPNRGIPKTESEIDDIIWILRDILIE
jgi:hypothetical protein